MKTAMKTIALGLLALVIATACGTDKNSLEPKEDLSKNEMLKAASGDCEGVHWSYEGEDGPEYWADLCTGFAACNHSSQSPINITGAVENEDLEELEFEYGYTKTNIINNGHTIQFNVDPGSILDANGQSYELLQFHYHSLSEHTYEGQYYPLEVHLVHLADDGNLAVVGIFFEEGDSNPLFEEYLSKFPRHKGSFSSDKLIELEEIVDDLDEEYYTYSGSLTTPPCSEIVTWHVMEEALEASAEQIAEFAEILHNNYRPIQALNGRTIYKYED